MLNFNIYFLYLRELISQTINSSSKQKPGAIDTPSNELLELTKIIVQKQAELDSYLALGKTRCNAI